MEFSYLSDETGVGQNTPGTKDFPKVYGKLVCYSGEGEKRFQFVEFLKRGMQESSTSRAALRQSVG